MCVKNVVTNAEVIAMLFVIAPQFESDDPIVIASYNALLDALRCMVNLKVLCDCGLLALANLLAHYLVMKNNPYLGVANSISEGQLSISASYNTNGNFYLTSPYGQAYWNIISRYRIGAYVTNTRRGWYGPSCCGYGFRF
jgi:hypothetical protein